MILKEKRSVWFIRSLKFCLTPPPSKNPALSMHFAIKQHENILLIKPVFFVVIWDGIPGVYFIVLLK